MDNAQILRHIDHTQLKAVATWKDVEQLCRQAIECKTASVCIPPSYVRRVKEAFGGQLVICTVIGFPLGYSTTETKMFEAVNAVGDGADEIDMVVNLCDVKNGDYERVTSEIAAVRAAAGQKVLKVIIETCYLSEEEKINLCGCVTDGGADYIKTSTGFGAGGALIEDVQLFKQHIGQNVKIKAAGGVRAREDFERFLEAGCDRIGTSSAVSILAGQGGAGY